MRHKQASSEPVVRHGMLGASVVGIIAQLPSLLTKISQQFSFSILVIVSLISAVRLGIISLALNYWAKKNWLSDQPKLFQLLILYQRQDDIVRMTRHPPVVHKISREQIDRPALLAEIYFVEFLYLRSDWHSFFHTGNY